LERRLLSSPEDNATISLYEKLLQMEDKKVLPHMRS